MDIPLPPSEDGSPPPPDIPYLVFEPPLQIQRQRAIHDILRSIAATPRFAGNIPRLLDVGCGEATFIRRLVPCEDELPLGQMTGVDIDDEVAQSKSWMFLEQPFGDEEDRWRGLDIRLLQGSFEALRIEDVGYHEVIVSAEVLEHLDPGPRSQFAPTLLGKLKPKVCIVTTPNREFNALFDFLSNLDPNAPAAERYRRDGVPYLMRHHDHRFEWTRQDFRSWALQAAEEFGYDVQFCGVGGLGRGMGEVGGENATDVLREAAEACGSPDSFLKGTDKWGELKGIVCDVDDDDKGVDILRKAFGDCSQIAVFVLKPQEESDSDINAPYTACSDGLKLVQHHSYQYTTEEFPPSLETVLRLLMSERLLHLIPELIREEWTRDDSEIQKDMFLRKKYGNSFNPRENVWDKQDWRKLRCEALRETERIFASLGGRVWEVKCVEIILDASKLWEGSFKLRRACHFRPEAFVDVMRSIKATEKTPEVLVENTKMKVELSQEDDKTVVTASFPAKRRPIPKEPWAEPVKLERVIFDEDTNDYGSYEEVDEFDDEFDEFELADEPDVFDDDEYAGSSNGDADRIVLPKPKNPEFRLPSPVKRSSSSSPSESVLSGHPGEFDTVIEWVAHTEGPRPELCLPQSAEVEGTLEIPGEKHIGQLFRVRFMGPKREIESFDDDGEDGEPIFKEKKEIKGVGSWWEAELEKTPEMELMPGYYKEEEEEATPEVALMPDDRSIDLLIFRSFGDTPI
ncbi:hypothetical protein BZA05DRAFT_476309 [Tricharina praecox]|uniref:uncharacterized protein n=1 Tax=Tricharina praecox TaxID=43433 RepID=UPI00221E603E|nr:uncharacterized protein BZA05DRAFT_477954 [Tricharina praecox]XP_051334571.1 uncharacterized protein BZA05DRAFT_477915 [Tricharina praecox]XP_051336528.1 uncharacterized protein BZA05DRAFT_476309 [Tricharina praecox]KAI5840879.1 hypothetical protein BZA05DRAFT_477954 [Tricharina praecox]KAI5840918.1 hypothetical protein BZA05DRAFT_477915 [Tricharina praecox]KAI5845894.1 hypothetical protein BZA05DRAFT_476309 [Tricharina praecox]